MGFFEKTAGEGFLRKVGIMFGNEFNIASLFTPLTLTLSPAGERGGGTAQREFDANFIQFTVPDARYMNICFEKSKDWDKSFHN
jgi:hypothetical protein